ncbi:MAG: enoyl-CoA hydratase/isomerase family protein [Anaerolineae bacterium]|nr:enoyl-CoA hydratase/isomerase family protein [Anaerolineae bacterium]
MHDTVDRVAVLTLNRPERHNSLVPELLEELLAALTAVATNPSIRAIVLQANGRSFSTGGDALGFVQHEHELETYSRRIVGLLNQVILALIDLPVPVITAVHGIVTGGSIGLVAASDIVLVTPEASFTPYYSVVGPSPDGGWTALMPHLIGSQRTAAAIYANRTITADEAVAWGLASRLVSAAEIRTEALALGQNIASMKPGSIRHSKQLLGQHRQQIAAQLAEELAHFVQQIVTEEGIGGFRDYVNKNSKRQVAI